MESKLPKPSGLKLPTPVVKSILPSDRIKPGGVFGFGVKTGSTSTTSLSAIIRQPLARDLSNFTNAVGAEGRIDRAGSPELVRTTASLHPRVRLRRSRSACDIRDMRPLLKRAESTMAPIPAKASRLNSSGGTATAASSVLTRPPRFAGATATATAGASTSAAATTAKRLVTAPTRPPNKRTGTAVAPAAKKPTVGSASNATAVSTTGAGKPINKRIPPYDFKARYADLLEKHKALKERYEEKVELMSNMESLPEQLEESQAALYSTQEQLRNTKTEVQCLERQVKSQTLKIEHITSCWMKDKDELGQLKQEHEKIATEHAQLSHEVIELRERDSTLTESNAHLEKELSITKELLFRSNMERKELHNTVMDLRGNIRVFCRVRPPLESEEGKQLCSWNYLDEATVEIVNPELASKNKTGAHMFSFDYVFHPGCRQEDIFDLVSPLIQSALDGYNICIFAYGQTGSGKTYTMDGVPENAGVIPRTVDLLFDAVRNYRTLGWEYEIRVTFLEIYNEVLYDLLSNEPKEMEIRMASGNRNDIYVSNITEETVTSADRLRQLMHIAKANRATAATVGNDRSSRSHAVTKIELIGTHAGKQETSIGSINLVDLAGSESPKTSIRMAETKNINRSLSELTNVILALLQKQDHIPYRNSKLTHLLMPSLGGNSKTLMFINVAPTLDCYVESVKSLRFAASVNSCKVAKAKRNRILNSSASGFS